MSDPKSRLLEPIKPGGVIMNGMVSPRPLVLLLGILLLAGCTASHPTSFYVLTASSSLESDPGGTRRWSEACPRVALAPVSLPGYLDRSGMVTRVQPNRLLLSELHHWAEPLRENFARVLAGNLNSLLCGEAMVVVSERESPRSDYRISVDVHRFEPLDRDQVLLTARWTVWKTGSGEARYTQLSTHSRTLHGSSHQAVAAAMSKTVAALSRDIVELLSELARELPNNG